MCLLSRCFSLLALFFCRLVLRPPSSPCLIPSHISTSFALPLPLLFSSALFHFSLSLRLSLSEVRHTALYICCVSFCAAYQISHKALTSFLIALSISFNSPVYLSVKSNYLYFKYLRTQTTLLAMFTLCTPWKLYFSNSKFLTVQVFCDSVNSCGTKGASVGRYDFGLDGDWLLNGESMAQTAVALQGLLHQHTFTRTLLSQPLVWVGARITEINVSL